MNRLFYTLFVALLFYSLDTAAVAQFVDSSYEGVDIVVESKYNFEGHDFGYDYYASNSNGYSVCVTIWITDSYNILDGLVSSYTPLILEPYETAYMGWVVQNDVYSPSNWEYQWEVTTDCLP